MKLVNPISPRAYTLRYLKKDSFLFVAAACFSELLGRLLVFACMAYTQIGFVFRFTCRLHGRLFMRCFKRLAKQVPMPNFRKGNNDFELYLVWLSAATLQYALLLLGYRLRRYYARL